MFFLYEVLWGSPCSCGAIQRSLPLATYPRYPIKTWIRSFHVYHRVNENTVISPRFAIWAEVRNSTSTLLQHFLSSSLPHYQLHRSPKHRQRKTMCFSASRFKALDIQGMFAKPVSKSERTQDMRSSCWSSNTLIPITNPNCYFECSGHQNLATELAHSLFTRPICSAISTQKPFEGLQKRNEVNVMKKKLPMHFPKPLLLRKSRSSRYNPKNTPSSLHVLATLQDCRISWKSQRRMGHARD